MSATAQLLSGPGNQTTGFVNSGVGASLTIAKPANLASGNHLLAVVWFRSETAPPGAPAGWTMIPPPAGTSVGVLAVYYKYVANAAAETATSYTWTSGATIGGRKVGTILLVSGGHPTALAGEVGGYTTGIAVNPVLPLTPLQVAAPQSLVLSVMGFNTTTPPAPTSLTDELGMTLAAGPHAVTTTGSSESHLYVASKQLVDPDSLGVNHWTVIPNPPSALGYMLALRTANTAPLVTLGGTQVKDSQSTVTLHAATQFGHVDSYEWRQSFGTPVPASTSGSNLTFTAPATATGTTLAFDVRATDNNGGSPVTSDWESVQVNVRPHQAWSGSGGSWNAAKVGKAWTLHEGIWSRPGESYVAPGITVPTLLAKPTFYIAHRGSGDEFPEHTMEAYRGVLASGGDGIEVSVQLTKDGVLVCCHDATLDRTTNSAGLIADRTWQDLYDNVRVTQQGILGPGQADVRIPKLSDVLAEFLGVKVIFIEAKTGPAATPIFAMLDTYAAQGVNLGDWVVYKQFFQGGTATKNMAHARGMKVWGYMDAGTTDSALAASDAGVDIWGVPDFMTLSRKAQIVARGKPVICWQVHRRSQVAEHQSIGLQGQMSSGLLYVSAAGRRQTKDQFTTMRKVPGDLWSANTAVQELALTYDTLGRAFHKSPNPICSTVMGSLCPTGASFTLKATIDFAVAPTTGMSGIAFSCANDQPFRPTTDDGAGGQTFTNLTGGYFLGLTNSIGALSLYKYAPGVWSPVLLQSQVIPGYQKGAPLDITVKVTPAGITVTAGPSTLSSTDTTYRGQYFHLVQGTTDQIARFAKLSVGA